VAFRAFVIWLALLAVAVLNGGFRQAVLIPRYGELTGHQLSTVLLCAGIVLVTYAAVPWIRPADSRAAIVMGIAWVLLTLTFEFSFGLLRGQELGDLLGDYDVSKGRIWVLVLVTTGVAPYATGVVRDVIIPPAR
jgi:hypothetical protein